MLTLLLVVCLLVMILGAPQWPYAQPYGYGWWPSGLGLVLFLIVLVLLLHGV